MPILRREFADFVLMWNSHYIRKQSNRPHVVPGQPFVLYHQPEAHQATNFAEVIPQDRLEELQNAFADDPYDLDAYLPDDTIDVCEVFAEEYGYKDDLRKKRRITRGILEKHHACLHTSPCVIIYSVISSRTQPRVLAF